MLAFIYDSEFYARSFRCLTRKLIVVYELNYLAIDIKFFFLQEEPIPSTSKGHDFQTEHLSTISRENSQKKPLKEVVKEIKERNKVKMTEHTAPLHLVDPRPGRFPLTTASFPPRARNDQRELSCDIDKG